MHAARKGSPGRRRSWGRSFVSASIACLLGTVASLGVVPDAHATNWFGATGSTGCNSGNIQDNGTMTYYRSSLTTKMYNAVANTLNNDVLPTDIVLQAEHSGWTSNTDVVYYDADYSTLCGYDWHPDDPSDPDTRWVAGLARCMTLSGSRCQRFYVHFDTSRMNQINDDGARTWACHETGHTLGLKHRNEGGCMPATVPANAHFFTDHDRNAGGHINDTY